MKLGLVRIAWALVAATAAACHFPEAKEPDPTDQSNVTATTMAGGAQTACDTARGVELVSALVSTLPHAHHARVDPVPSILLAEGECQRALAEKQAALEEEGQELEARRMRLDQEQRRDLQDRQLFDQLQALCRDGNARACDAYAFADGKRGCCTWHHGARMCSQGKVVCFDGVESESCSC